MANKIQYIDSSGGDHIFPVTHERGVFDDAGGTIEPKLQHANDLDTSLVQVTSYTGTQIKAMSKYSYYIVSSSGKYNTSGTNRHYRIEVDPGDYVYVTSNSSNGASVAFFKSTKESVSGGTPDYATGYDNRVVVAAGKTARFVAPADARVLYLYAGLSTDTSYPYTPDGVVIRKVAAVTEDAPLMTVPLTGRGDTLTLTKKFYDFIPGHKYRVHIAAWPRTEVTASATAYLFYVASYDNTDTVTYPVIVLTTATSLGSQYDFVVPNDSKYIRIGGRINAGATGITEIEDLTALKVAGAEKGDIVVADLSGYPSVSGLAVHDLTGEMTYTADELRASNLTRLTDGQINVAAPVKSATVTNRISSSSSYYNFRIPLEGVAVVKIYQYGSDQRKGSAIVDENDKILVQLDTLGALGSSSGGDIEVCVPDGAVDLIYSMYASSSVSYVTLKYRAGDADTERRIGSLETEISGDDIEYNDTPDLLLKNSGVSVYCYGGINNLNSVSVGDNITELTFDDGYENAKQATMLIPLEDYSTVEYYWRAKQSTNTAGNVWLDGDKDIVGKIQFSSGTRTALTIPSTAEYLLVSNVTLAGGKLVLHKADTMGARVTALEAEAAAGSSANSLKTGMVPSLAQGAVGVTGILDGSSKYVTTEVIFGPFAIELNDGYVKHSYHMYNRDGEMVSYNAGHHDIVGSYTSPGYFSLAKTQGIAQLGYRCVFKREDGGDILPTDDIVKSFTKFDDTNLHKWIPNDMPKYPEAWDRIMQFCNIIWTPLVKVPNSKYNTTHFLAGETNVGIPYSHAMEKMKFVPNCVSIRTYLSAASNKRSLLYTENMQTNSSEYGISYTATNDGRSSYFGAICSSFLAWALDDPIPYRIVDYAQAGSKVNTPTIDNLRPLDIYTNSGHVAVISAIYMDDFGRRRFIEVAEMTQPQCLVSLYTPEEFAWRLETAEATVRRYSSEKLAQITEPADMSDFVQQIPGDTIRTPQFNPDIMTFAGDYACFKTGDKIILNARRNSTYTGVQLYKGTELVQSIDISEYEADGLYDDDEDWVIVNLTTLNLAAGKYKARLTDGTNTTDYTYFEIVGLTMSISGESGAYVIDWTTTGTPLALSRARGDGISTTAHHLITAEEAELGSATLSWTGSASSTYNRVRLEVNGDYGMVADWVTMPAAS